MSRDQFPVRIDPHRIFAAGGEIHSDIPLECFPRLLEYLSAGTGVAKLALHFSLDENGRRMISGTLKASTTMRCQRCLQNADFPLHSTLQICVVDSEEEAADLPVELETVVSGNGALDLATLVEDELILSLPLSPRHDDVQCNNYFVQLNREVEGRNNLDNTNKGPFAGLRELADKQA